MEKTWHFDTGEILPVDKPEGWTSFDVVRKLRGAVRRYMARHAAPGDTPAKAPKTGHAGTLDPLATGLLIVCTGAMTKRISEFQAGEKEYTGTFFAGATTPSYDRETSVDHTYDTTHLNQETIRAATAAFTGTIRQVPPAHSAVLVDGSRAYRKARKGQAVELKPREVEVMVFDITGIDLPYIHFRVVCSKGTYIRSLAYDFGRALGSGAYLHALRRTRIGQVTVDQALTPERWAALLDPASHSG